MEERREGEKGGGGREEAEGRRGRWRREGEEGGRGRKGGEGGRKGGGGWREDSTHGHVHVDAGSSQTTDPWTVMFLACSTEAATRLYTSTVHHNDSGTELRVLHKLVLLYTNHHTYSSHTVH